MPFSLALTEPQKHQGPVAFTYELIVDGRRHKVQVTLQPGESGELPVHGDQMVYLSLLQLALQNPSPEPVLRFQRNDVFDLLRWPKKGSRYQRLRDALRRLWDLGIIIETAMVSRSGQPYSRQTEMTKLINRVRIGAGRDSVCEVEWGDIVRQAFVLGDFKRLDWDLMMDLGKPLTAQLYRLLDRVTMAGESKWEVEWSDLAGALGMSADSYARPARLKQVLTPHCDALVEHGIIDGVEYVRGGRFIFHVRNYLRVQIRRVLEELGVYERAAAQLLNAHDEVAIMVQCDCLQHGSRRKAKNPGAYLVSAVKEGYDLTYPSDEPETFAGIWGFLGDGEREAYHRAGIKLLGVAEDLFETSRDPSAWSLTMRAVVRFMVCQNIDPEQVMPGGKS